MPTQRLTKAFEQLTAVELAQRKNFDCGVDSLNDYLIQHMRQHDQKNIAKSFIYLLDGQIAAYYTLSPTVIDFAAVYPQLSKHLQLPKHPVPAILLAKLAVDLKFQGRGYARLFMAEVITKTFLATQTVGGVGLVVDAIDHKAAAFYAQYGFAASPVNPLKLFMSLQHSSSS